MFRYVNQTQRQQKESLPTHKTSSVLTRPSSYYDFNELCKTHASTLDVFRSSCNWRRNHNPNLGCNSRPPYFTFLSRLFGLSPVYAEGPSSNGSPVSAQSDKETGPKAQTSTSTSNTGHPIDDKTLEALAHLYIAKESGWDRVTAIFKEDHRGKSSEEINLISVTLVQVFVITFFCKYVPVAKFARKEFIREHQATVFRTRLEALRRMNDHIFLKAAAEGGWLSAKVTMFSASFLLISQSIASYRNKTSVLEYSVASAITGGLARLNMGLRGIISGSLVGTLLGSAVGLIAFSLLSAYDITQQERHLTNIISKLEVQRSIEGDAAFQRRVAEAVEQYQEKSLSAS